MLECVLFTFAKPYLNFVYHGICRICQIILVLRGFFCLFLLQLSWWLVLYCKTTLADISSKGTKRKYTQISLYKMFGIHSRIFYFVF